MALRNAFELVSTSARQDTLIAGVGAPADAEATGSGTLIALLKRLRTLLNGGLPAALGGAGGVKVEQQGNVVVGNFPASQAVTGPVTDAQLRASAVPISGPLTDAQLRASAPAVRDDYVGGEILADQTGAGAVLTFTFASAVQLVVVHGNGLVTDTARADPFGGTPTATLGIPCGDEAATYIPVTTSSVKVFAPVGMVITVWGFRRA